MWLVARQSDGTGGHRVPVPDLVRWALIRWYTGEGSPSDEEVGITLVQQARRGSRWIACGCLGDGVPPPIMTPAFLSEAETYYLRRLTGPGRAEHGPDCPFLAEQATNRISGVSGHRISSDPPAGYFEVLTPAPEKLAQRPDRSSIDDRTRNTPVPRLARLLWRLMEAAGLNRVLSEPESGEPRSIRGELAAVRRAAWKMEIAPGVELGRLLWTHGAALESRRTYAGLRDLARDWPSNHAPQAFLTLYAPSFSGSIIRAVGCEPIRIANRVQSGFADPAAASGPYLVIVVIGSYPEASGYQPLRAYAQPIYSGNRLFPVHTDGERAFVRGALVARHAMAATATELLLHKPLFDALTPAGPYRPDFLLQAQRGDMRRRLAVYIAEGHDDGGYGSPPKSGSPSPGRPDDAWVIDDRDVRSEDFAARLVARMLQ